MPLGLDTAGISYTTEPCSAAETILPGQEVLPLDLGSGQGEAPAGTSGHAS